MPKRKAQKIAESCSSEDEWEEVEENDVDQLDLDKKEDVEIEFDLPDVVKKQSKKHERMKEWLTMFIKRAINKSKKEIQVYMHQVHLLCLLSVGFQLNQICNDEDLQGLLLSMLPVNFIKIFSYNLSREKILSIINWTKQRFDKENNSASLLGSGIRQINAKRKILKRSLETDQVDQKIDLVMIHVLVFRSLGFQTRLVMSLQPISLRPLTGKQLLEKATKMELSMKKTQQALALDKNKKKVAQLSHVDIKESIPQLDGANDESDGLRRSSRKRTNVLKPTGNKLPSKRRQTAVKSGRNDNSKKNSKSKLKPPENELDDFEPTVEIDKLAKATVSKYNFSSDETHSYSDENLPTATKIGKIVKAKQYAGKTDRKITEGSKLKKEEAITAKTKNRKAKVAVKEEKLDGQFKPEDLKETKRTLRKQIRKAPKPKKEKQEETDSYDADEFDPLLDDSDDDDFVEVESYKKKKATSTRQSASPKGSTSTSRRKTAGKTQSRSHTSVKPQPSINQWVEVHVRNVGWVCIDCFSGEICEPKEAESKATQPIRYVLTFDNDDCVKDVTARYASNWLITTRKLRVNAVDQTWWKKTLDPYKTKNEALDLEENQKMEENLLSAPIPKTITAFKDHPLFVLRRHILKYQAIYPPDVPAIGFVRGEEILPRSSVHLMHTREKWLQSAMSVKDGEKPYKMVSSYLLNKKLNRESDAPSLALFGKWQTEPYQPSVAKDGKVPRNEYGNVDLFQPSMLPIGCVQLRLPMLHKVANKLNIDIAVAIVGFDTHQGYPHPSTDGYVVCVEHEKILREAWEEEQTHAEEKQQEKREKRVYGRWKFFIRGMLALHHVRRKYNSKDGDGDNEHHDEKPVSGVAWQAERLQEAKKQKPTRRTRRGAKAKKKVEDLPFETETM